GAAAISARRLIKAPFSSSMTGSEKRSTSRDRFCDRQRVDVLDAGLISQPRQERVERTLLRAGIRHAQGVWARLGPSRHAGGSALSDRASHLVSAGRIVEDYAHQPSVVPNRVAGRHDEALYVLRKEEPCHRRGCPSRIRRDRARGAVVPLGLDEPAIGGQPEAAWGWEGHG